MSSLLPAWEMSQAVNDFLLEHVPESGLKACYSPRTRSVAAQFAHIHNVRVRWLKHAAPPLAQELAAFPRGAEPSRAELRGALRQSAQVIGRFLEQCEEAGKVKAWKGPPSTFLGYLTAHEAHHRGLAMAALRLSGHKVPDEVVYGMWQWGMQRSLRGERRRG